MKMRKFLQNKLVRDNIPTIMEEKGSILHWHYLNDKDYDEALRQKLIEESEEVEQAPDREETIEEIADILEAIDALCALHTISKEELIEIQTKKREEKGGYFTRKFLDIAEHPENSPQVEYCLAQPHKYPEIKD